MQDLSYSFLNQHIDLKCCDLELLIYSFSNAYSLDPSRSVITENGDIIVVSSSGLLTDGGQTKADGRAEIKITKQDQIFQVSVNAAIDNYFEEIRSVKLRLNGLETGKIIGLIDAEPKEIPDEGIILHYPEGWRELGTPLVGIVQKDKTTMFFRSLDIEVRRKLFSFIKQGEKLCAELIFEPLATEMSNSVSVPLWELGFTSDIKSVYERHNKHIENAFSIKHWDERNDVPLWARKISLIAAIHGQHWTGYIFNDYASMLENIKRLTDKIEPEHILAYLPGWEGRYYWKYGNYGPDERMGGKEGLHKLAEESHKLGVHLMPMYGINIAGIHFNGFMEWGDVSEVRSPSGNISRGSVDWDASRHYDHGSGRLLNPAALKWQNRLVKQIVTLSKEYGFDAAFLDIAAFWQNDPNHAVYPGVCQLVNRLHNELEDFLVTGEGWYDALTAAIPILQCGHTDGHMNWHDESNPSGFEQYAREFAHLCLGDPSRFSTGVHELGYNPTWRAPLRRSVIPTLTIVDGTLQKAEKEADLIIQDAKEYAERYLKE